MLIQPVNFLAKKAPAASGTTKPRRNQSPYLTETPFVLSTDEVDFTTPRSPRMFMREQTIPNQIFLQNLKASIMRTMPRPWFLGTWLIPCMGSATSASRVRMDVSCRSPSASTSAAQSRPTRSSLSVSENASPCVKPNNQASPRRHPLP